MANEETSNLEVWVTTYCAAFREIAASRGWSAEDIESGWLDNLPSDAWRERGYRGDDPREVAASDVVECEIEAANAA